jgi:hypothetical protein
MTGTLRRLCQMGQLVEQESLVIMAARQPDGAACVVRVSMGSRPDGAPCRLNHDLRYRGA